MTAYRLVILCSLLAVFVLELAARLFNLRAFPEAPPAVLAGFIDRERHRRAGAYQRAAARLGIVSDLTGLVLLVAAIQGGWLGLLDGLVRELPLSAIGLGLIFFAAVGLVQGLVDLPFAAWRTFRLEARFGLNRTSPATFVLDRLKGAALAAVIGGPLLAAILWFFGAFGPLAWLAALVLVSLVAAVLQYLAPACILPLFNRYQPLPDGELKSRLTALAGRLGFHLAGIFVMDGSRRSTRANAFFTGFGAKKRIALFDTLLGALTPAEIEAVLAHEIGHWQLGHVRRLFALSVARTAVFLGLMAVFVDSPGLVRAMGFTVPSVYAGLLSFAVLAAPLGLVLSAVTGAFSRAYEREADEFAAKASEAADLRTALIKLSIENVSHPSPHPLMVALHHNHPPLAERLDRLERLERRT